YKSEFLAQHYKGRLHPLQHYVFGFADKLARFGSIAPGITNAILTGTVTGPVIKRIAGVAQQRALPRLAQSSFVSGHDFTAGEASQQAVFLWPDTWNNYYHPQTLVAAETVLAEAGFKVQTAKRHVCCGRPLYDFGFLDHARAYLKDVLEHMAPQIDAGMP